MLTIVIAIVFALARINQADDAVSFQLLHVQLGSIRSEAISAMDRHSDRIKVKCATNVLLDVLILKKSKLSSKFVINSQILDYWYHS